MGNICCPFLTESSAPEEVNLLPIQEQPAPPAPNPVFDETPFPDTFCFDNFGNNRIFRSILDKCDTDTLQIFESTCLGVHNYIAGKERKEGLTRKDTHLLIRIAKHETNSATINATQIEIALNPSENISFDAVFGRFLEEHVRKSYFKKLSLSVQNSLYDERVVSLFDNFIAYLSAFHVKCVEFVFNLRKDQQLENFIQIFKPAILSPKGDMAIQMIFGLVATQFPLLNHIRLNDLRAGSRMMEHFKIVEIELSFSDPLRATSIDAIKKKWDLLSASEKSQKVEVKAGYHFFQYDISVGHFEAESKLTVAKSQGEEQKLLSVNVFKFAGSGNFPFNVGVLYFENGRLHGRLHSILLKAKSREMLEEQFKRIFFGEKTLFEEGCKEFISKVNSPN